MILVTGGLGFIGSHIALSLLAQGHEIVIADNLVNSSLQTLERLEYISRMYIPFVKVDIRNTPALNKVFEQYAIDAVIHTAGFKSLEESRLKPLEYYNNNVSSIMSLLRAMQRAGVRNFVHLSSLAVYGVSSTVLQEDDEFNHIYNNPYITTQQMIEKIIEDTVKTDTEWRVAILRLSNVAGAFEQGILGETIVPMPKNIIPLAMQVAASQRDCLDLYRYELAHNQTTERSFVHVADVCKAIGASLGWLSQQGHCCESFNIAHDLTSMEQLLQTLSQVTQQSIATQDMQISSPELMQLGANINKAKQLLNWEPELGIEKMLEDQWLFYQNGLAGN